MVNVSWVEIKGQINLFLMRSVAGFHNREGSGGGCLCILSFESACSCRVRYVMVEERLIMEDLRLGVGFGMFSKGNGG